MNFEFSRIHKVLTVIGIGMMVSLFGIYDDVMGALLAYLLIEIVKIETTNNQNGDES